MNKTANFIMAILICAMFVGCGQEDNNQLQKEIDSLKKEIAELEVQRNALKTEVVALKEETGTAKYVVTFQISQQHFTLDLGEHLKDAMNDISIQIPVDKEYFDSISVGDTIADDFRIGSLVMNGSFGNWKITVKEKEIQ